MQLPSMDATIKYFQEFDISKAADLLSFVTFILALYASFAIRKVKNNFLFRSPVVEIPSSAKGSACDFVSNILLSWFPTALPA